MLLTNLQFILFGDYKKYEADQERIISILSKFIENGVQVIPTTFQQINPVMGLKASERIMFNNSKENYSVQIGIDAIQIQKTLPKIKLYNYEAEIKDFMRTIKKIIKSLSDTQEGLNLGSRISIVVENTYNTTEIVELNKIYEMFSNSIPNYSIEETFEWNTRVVKRLELSSVNLKDEIVNFVNEVSRINGNFNSNGEVEELDTIQTKVDINTLYIKNDNRIDLKFASEFLDDSLELLLSQHKSLEGMIVENK